MMSLKSTFIAAASLAVASGAVAATHTVDDNFPANFTTLEAAITAAATGDTIIVKPGTYTSAAPVTITKKLRIVGPNANVSPVANLASRSAEAVIQLNGNPGLILQDHTANGTELIGLKLRGVSGGAGTGLIQVRGAAGTQSSTEFTAPDGIVLRRNFFESVGTKFYSIGNGAASGANDWVVEDNLFKDWGAGASADTAIFHTNSYNLTFRGNRLQTAVANGDDRGLNFVGLIGSVITDNVLDQSYGGTNYASGTVQIGNGSKRNVFSNNRIVNGATNVVVYSGTDNTPITNFVAGLSGHPEYVAGDGATLITEDISVTDNLIENAKTFNLDIQAGSDRDDLKSVAAIGNTVRQAAESVRAAAANTGYDAVRVLGQNGVGGTDVLASVAENIDIISNSVRFTGAAFGDANVVGYNGVRLRNLLSDVLVENNTITGVNVSASASAISGNFPPSTGFSLTTTQKSLISGNTINQDLPASANVRFQNNAITGFPNSATLLGFGPTTTLTPAYGDLPSAGSVVFSGNDLGTAVNRQVLSGAPGATFNADSNFWNTGTPTAGVNYDGNVSVGSPLGSGRVAVLGTVTPASGSTVVVPANDVRSPIATNATISIQNTGTAAIAVTALNITGTNAADFSASLPLDIAGGTTRNFTVSFRPSAAGARTASLTIVTDQGNQTFTLNGNGVVVATGVDTDGDGLTDIHETQIGTNPNSRDSDGDGLEDGVEVALGTNPNAADVFTDADGDRLPDNAGIDPNAANRDTDGDNYTDGYEVAAGTDPNSAASKPSLGDVNGSGTADFADGIAMLRVFLGLQPLNSLSNPNAFDVNRDGFKDNADAAIVINTFLGNIEALPFPL